MAKPQTDIDEIPRVYTTGDVAKESGLTRESLRWHIKRGRLTPDSQTGSGLALYHRETVDRFVRRLEKRQARYTRLWNAK